MIFETNGTFEELTKLMSDIEKSGLEAEVDERFSATCWNFEVSDDDSDSFAELCDSIGVEYSLV